MSRQIQIRRGTAKEHEGFIGALGEITMDTDEKTLRVHDGGTVGGIALARKEDLPDLSTIDYVVESGCTENGWYRKYKSGWIEQGGCYTGGKYSPTIIFPFPMKDNSYFCSIYAFDQNDSLGNNASSTSGHINTSRTAENMVVRQRTGAGNSSNLPFFWEIKGIAAD